MRLLIFLNRVPVPELDIVFAEGVRASAAMAVQSAARLAGADWCFFTAVVDVFDQSLWPRMALLSVSDAAPACLSYAGLVAQLNASLPALDSCTLVQRTPCAGPTCSDAKEAARIARVSETMRSRAVRRDDSALGRAVASMARQLQVDGLNAVIADARSVIAAVRLKL
jgi:hypothetical protein